jgi:hypothetical protein
MTSALILPLVGLLIGIPGIPGLRKLPKLRLPQKAAVDTLPPVWKPYPLLAVENQFVFATLPPIGPRGPALRITNDPRRLRIRVDPDSGTVTTVAELGEVTLGDGTRTPITQFHRDLAAENFRRLWAERSRLSVNTIAGKTPVGGTQQGQGLRFNLPIQLPKVYTSLLGPGGPAINVSGSENIKLAGTSSWSNQQTGQLGQRRSLFPSLDMEQDLDIRLEGQLSDRVKVNLLQNSAVQIPLANKIAINYKGDEDDIVQSLDLGNTNLALPGTQYVSYSGRNEGLFGMKATTRFGPLDFTLLASKQEGKSERASYAGGSSSQERTLYDLDYVQSTYFLLYDPSFETQDVVQNSIRLFVDEGTNYASLQGRIRGRAFVDPRTARLDSTGTCETCYTPSVRGFFTELSQGTENDPKGFQVLNDVYGKFFKVIRLTRPVAGEYHRLAVTYRYQNVVGGQTLDPLLDMGGAADTVLDVDPDGSGPEQAALIMKLLRAPLGQLPALPNPIAANEVFDPNSPFYPTRELELRNFYNLGGQGIAPKTLKMVIRQGQSDPPLTSIQPPAGAPIPYIEVLGLDEVDESTDTPKPGHDGVVDAGQRGQFRALVDFKNGVLCFPDIRPFAPRISDADTGYRSRPFDKVVNDSLLRLLRREALVGLPDAPNGRNSAIYDKRKPIRQDARYFIDVDFTASAAGNEINLGRSNIIEGSDAVTINGRRLEREKDYTIDYDLGRVTLKAAPAGTDQVNVDYSYAPLFQQASRTLLGSAFRLVGRDKHLGGAFMYESRSAQDLRPRLGEEPSRVLIGDLNAEWRMQPEFLTRWVDALPGVRTTAPSELNVSAEMGASLPNPNTFNEVFIDDMEGVRDAVSLTMTPERWAWSSVPSRKDPITGIVDSIEAAPFHQRNAEVHWYTPLNAVKERELKPNLKDAQGAQNSRQTLAISVPRRPPGVPATDSLWVGLTYTLDAVGLDLSRAQFIELWVNDFRNFAKVPRLLGQTVRLHVDIGSVSEDQRRSPGKPATGFDSEDLLPRDNQLDVTGTRNEDTGLDGVLSTGSEPADPSLVTAGTGDPAGDDFAQPVVDNEAPSRNMDPARWVFTNGTEGNKNVRPVPDTEDLNLNNSLDQDEGYFEYTIDLASSPADSAYPGFYASETATGPVEDTNGWRRYRIPISDSLRVQFGSPQLTLARHVRVWLEGITQTDDINVTDRAAQIEGKRPLLVLGGIDIIGSRWLATDPTTDQTDAGTTITLNSVNNVDNADIYVAPFDPGSTRNGAQDLTRREQSIELEFTQLQPQDTLEVFKTFSLSENYSRYGTLRFYAAGFEVAGYDSLIGSSSDPDSLFYFVRFASDEQGANYYEYRAPVPRSSRPQSIAWSEVLLKLTDLSNLKLDPEYNFAQLDTVYAPGAGPGVTLVVRGQPSFTRLRRISAGVINLETSKSFSTGRLWLDEMRATDVARDRGQAYRLGVSGRMANLMSYNVSYNASDEDFLQVGETRGSGSRTTNFTAGTSFDLHRFFTGTGLVLPITFNIAGTRAQPRYTAGDDVVRTGAIAEASESRTDTRNYGISYQRTWSERSNPLLRYTLGGISANISRTTSETSNPSAIDTSRSTAAAVNYSISPRRLLPVQLPGTRFKVWPLPERFYWNYGVSTRSSRSYDRRRDGTPVLRNITIGRAASIDFGADTRPFELLQHQFQAKRNLTLPEELSERIGFINLGRVVQWSQSFNSRYNASLGSWVRPQLNGTSSYGQNNGPEISPDLSIRQVNNAGSFTVAWLLPFDRLGAATKATRDTTKRGPPAWKGLLSRLGPLSLDAGVTRSSSYSRLTGTPALTYLVGLSNEPGLHADSSGRVRAVFGNSIVQTQNLHGGARTRISLPRAGSIQTNTDISVQRVFTNDLINRQRRIQYPTLDVDYGKLPELFGLKKLFVNPKIRTVFSRNRTTDYSNSVTPTNIATSSEWRPMVGLTGDFRNGTRTEFRIQRRATDQENRQNLNSITSESNTDIDLSLTRSYTKGQRVSFLGKANTVKANITLGLTGAYSRLRSETRFEGQDRPYSPRADDRLNINARGSYGFSSNVTGNGEVGFSQSHNKLTDIVNRSVRVELRAQFTF